MPPAVMGKNTCPGLLQKTAPATGADELHEAMTTGHAKNGLRLMRRGSQRCDVMRIIFTSIDPAITI